GQGDADAADIGLALDADIEQAGMEGDGHRQPGEDEIGRVVERIADALARAEGAGDHQRGGPERIFAHDENDETGDQEGHREIDQRDEPVFRPVRQLCERCAHYSAASILSSTPAISRPSSPSGVSGERSPTMRPANMTNTRSASERISSSSTETSRIALPASRISMIRLWM